MGIKVVDGKKILKEMKFFDVMDYEKEANYLSEQSKNGWRFKKVSGYCVYTFEECAPEDVVYQLDYNQEGVKNKEEYVQMFSDCGWEYLQDYCGYSYFRKTADQVGDDNEIFCDDDSRLDMMKRVFKGRIIPLVLLFFCFVSTAALNFMNPNGLVRLSLFYDVVFIAIVVLYLSIFARFALKYREYLRNLGRI